MTDVSLRKGDEGEFSGGPGVWTPCFHCRGHRFHPCVLWSVTQLYLTLCSPMDSSLPGPSVHEIFQARTLEWVAIFYTRGSSCPRNWTLLSCIRRQILYHWATWEAWIRWGKKKQTGEQRQRQRWEWCICKPSNSEDFWKHQKLPVWKRFSPWAFTEAWPCGHSFQASGL